MHHRLDSLLHAVTDGAARLQTLREEFVATYGAEPTVVVSAPGRTEIIGNHTDHNGGRVVAAAVDLDALIVASPADESRSSLKSVGWPRQFEVDYEADRVVDTHDTERLMRGVAAGLVDAGFATPPYRAVMDSRVTPGSGLSSSAALVVGLAGVHAVLSGQSPSALDIARAGQYAENHYMDKPSGLMDQTASAVGGAVAIDFADSSEPHYTRLQLDIGATGNTLVVVNSGGSHADLTGHYAAIPREMRAVAAAVGASNLVETSREALSLRLNDVRTEVGDRAVLRAFHFFDEQDRVSELAKAAEDRRFDRVLEIMNASGDSSWMLLQNIHPDGYEREQPLAVALYATRAFLNRYGSTGACRVHGGGFAGTILAAIPTDRLEEYRTMMTEIFGEHSVMELHIRDEGVITATL